LLRRYTPASTRPSIGKLLKGPWVTGEQYTICDPRMAAGYSADEEAKLLPYSRRRFS
jgi:hypothetical protein